MRPLVSLERARKEYGEGAARIAVLRDVELAFLAGEFAAIVGASGSGKSTLLHLIGGLDRPTSGAVLLEGRDLSTLPDDELAEVRNRRIGFVFQSFHLIPHLTVLENVEVPAYYAGTGRRRRREIAGSLLERVGLGARLDHLPSMLSGGECQRAAIARALVNEPALLLADEPTGNLDTASGASILDLFRDLHAAGRTILLVTHNPEVAAAAGRRIEVRDGLVVADDGAAGEG
ncbi:MAG TPA: ABC transporter ATP-binding protein [Planctomycetota bacterium]|jgi:putative ABC transport system ATP-binding protein|nr:ABC transporter ATP-binding protein [Planctomycetota bacterium]